VSSPDLAVTDIDDIQHLGTVGGVAAFTFGSVSTNVGLVPIPWLFTVREAPTTPWVIANGFSWFHHHSTKLDPPSPKPGIAYDNHYGRHPHMQLYIFRQPDTSPGLDNLTLIGCSDLKHGFKTADSAPLNPHGHHFLHPGNSDPYGAAENQNRSFYSPVSEINPTSFVVKAHNHLSTWNPVVKQYERSHGEADHAGSVL